MPLSPTAVSRLTVSSPASLFSVPLAPWDTRVTVVCFSYDRLDCIFQNSKEIRPCRVNGLCAQHPPLCIMFWRFACAVSVTWICQFLAIMNQAVLNVCEFWVDKSFTSSGQISRNGVVGVCSCSEL